LLIFNNGYTQIISELLFEGNSKTKSQVLFDQIGSKKGAEYNPSQVKDDIDALKSLHLFSEIKSDVTSLDGNQVRLTFFVKEVFTIIPVANIGGLSSDHAFWFTIGINEFNAFGNGDVLSANYTYFERHSVELFYQNRKFRNTELGLASFLSLKSSIEPLYFVNDVKAFYNFTQWRVEELFTYYKSWNSQILFGGGFFREQYLLNLKRTQDEYEDLVPSRVISDKLTIKTIYNFEKINYLGHIKDGLHFNAGTDFIYNINERVFSDALFIKSFLELKNYIRYSSRANLASRVYFGFSTNNGSPFTSFVKDDYLNARGVGDRSARGFVELTINNEWRQTLLWKNGYYFQLVGFADISSIVPSHEILSDIFKSRNIDLFVGAGLRLGLPNIYKTIVRIDISFDPSENNFSSIIFGLGQFF
jgi:outer membrane protein assembly factor BamA